LLEQWLPALRIIGIVLSVAVILFVLLQTRSAGLGSAFGGSSAGSVFKTRRGVERLVFNLTIIFIVLFALIAGVTAALVR
jgi:preprotein translocase subunit SecG